MSAASCACTCCKFCAALFACAVARDSAYRVDTPATVTKSRLTPPALARFTESCISIPVHCALSDDDVGRIVDAVKGGW